MNPEEAPYTRAEVEALRNELPRRGVLCPRCRARIPRFADLPAPEEERIRLLAKERPLLAMKALRDVTGCSLPWAKLWAIHAGEPNPIPCPYCGGALAPERTKQCRHCKRDWHDPDNITWLGQNVPRAE